MPLTVRIALCVIFGAVLAIVGAYLAARYGVQAHLKRCY